MKCQVRYAKINTFSDDYDVVVKPMVIVGACNAPYR
jgi:hypothetical protein